MSTITTNSEAAILSRLIAPDRGDLSADAAHSLLDLKFDQRDQARMHELVQMRRERDLAPEEEAELEGYRHIGHLLELIHSKARLSLAALKRAADPLDG